MTEPRTFWILKADITNGDTVTEKPDFPELFIPALEILSLSDDTAAMEAAMKNGNAADEKRYIIFHTRAFDERSDLAAKMDDPYDRGFKDGWLAKAAKDRGEG